MECRDFRDIVTELARNQARGGATNHDALDHARQCDDCATLLADEARLAASLSALRARDERLRAPHHLERTLLEEFRTLQRPGPAVPAPRRVHRNWWMLAAAAAALVLAVWPGLWRQPAPPADRIALSLPAMTDGPAMPESATADIPESPASEAEPAPLRPTAPEESAASPAVDTPSKAAPGRRGPQVATQPRITGELVSATGAELPAETPAEAAAAQREFVTEFVPLTYGAWTPAAPEARLVRVRLPSTALLYFGLPAAAGTASVEADVVLGEDGLAHAVRFVRPAIASTGLADRGSRTPQAY